MAGFDKWLNAIPGNATVAEASRTAFALRIEDVAKHLPLAAYHADENVEHVHRLRVGTRRSAAVLRLYAPLTSEKDSLKLKRRLKAIRRAASPARDLDVFIARLTPLGETFQPVVDRLRTERLEAQSLLVECCNRFHDGDRLRQTLKRLINGIPRKSESPHRLGDQAFRKWARRRLAHAVDNFTKAMAIEESAPSSLHQFRIEGKRLRYLIELLTPGLPDHIRKEAYPRIVALQDQLGSINDHVVAIDRLRGWRSLFNKHSRQSIKDLVNQERTALAIEIAKFDKWWTNDRAAKMLSLLACTREQGMAR